MLYGLLISELRKFRVFLVIRFDEVAHLLSRGSEVLYDLSRLREESIPAQITIVTHEHRSTHKKLSSPC